MSEFYSIVTNIGTAKIANAEVTNQKLDIVHYAVGDSGGNYYSPTVDQTELRNERWRGTAVVDIDPREPNVILITTWIPDDVGGFDVREIGIFDADGDLIVVGKVAEFYKPVLAEGSTLDSSLKTRLVVSNTANITLKNDPNVIRATKYYVDTEVLKISDSLSDLRDDFNSHTAQYDNDLASIDVRLSALKIVPNFLTLSVPSGFSNGYVRYRKMPDGLAEITILLDKNAAFVGGENILLGTLPTGFRPLSWVAEKLIVIQTQYSTEVAGALARLYVSGNGEIRIQTYSNGTYGSNAIRISNVNILYQSGVE